MKRSVRSLARFAVAAQVVFVASWLVAEALHPEYSGRASGVSALAAEGAPHAWIVGAGFVVFGLGIAALAPGLRFVLTRRDSGAVAAGLFVVAGLSIVVLGLSRLDCDLNDVVCRARLDAGSLSWHTSAHLWAGLVMRIALVLTPFALARALWPSPAAALSLLCGGVGFAICIAALILYGGGAPDGVVERVELVITHLWAVIVAAGILYETRPLPKLSAPAALRPRDFFGSAWSGEGLVLAGPGFLSRRFVLRFELSRETTWLTDDVALVRDRAVLLDREEERLRYAGFVDPTHIHVSSDDMPDGAEVTITEEGYQVAPYRLLIPVGPLRFMLRARDEAAVELSGELAYVVRLSWHGLPVARVEIRARPVDTEAVGAGARPRSAAEIDPPPSTPSGGLPARTDYGRIA